MFGWRACCMSVISRAMYFSTVSPRGLESISTFASGNATKDPREVEAEPRRTIILGTRQDFLDGDLWKSDAQQRPVARC